MDPRPEWKAQEPPEGFADRVMAALDAEEAPKPAARDRARRAGVAASVALAAGVALAIGWRASGPPPAGEAIAKDREQVAMGRRAIAVLEPGASAAWSGDEVTQRQGDIFYRVEPGGSFRVHTVAGDVEVLGTCFRVKVSGSEVEVNGRDVRSGAIGAALGAVALVSVYEGKVALSHARESVTLTAGESARADDRGVRRDPGDGARRPDGAPLAGGAATESDDPLVAANANLADSVREYKRRLESIEAQKKAVEKELSEAQGKLAAAENDGHAPIARSDFDLDEDDWKELAAKGEVRAKIPCSAAEWDLKPDELTKAGFSPQDAQPIEDALKAVGDHAWATLRPLCLQALKGNAQVVDALGASTCQQLIFTVANQNKEDTGSEMRAVAEIRAGVRPLPKNPDELGAVGKMVYELSGESKALESKLAQSLGPADAHRFVYDSPVGCWSNSAWNGGPAPPATPKR